MDECPFMGRLESLSGTDVPPDEQARIVGHLQRCPQCRVQMARISWLAQALSQAYELAGVPDSPHLSDLEIAAFAAGTVTEGEAARLKAHLAQCGECVRLIGAVRRVLDEHESLFGPQPSPVRLEAWWKRAAVGLRGLFSTWQKAVAAVGALVLYLAHTGLLAALAGLLLAAGFPWPPTYDGVPRWLPLTLVPEGPARFIVFVALCLLGSIGCRLLARRLYLFAADRSES